MPGWVTKIPHAAQKGQKEKKVLGRQAGCAPAQSLETVVIVVTLGW